MHYLSHQSKKFMTAIMLGLMFLLPYHSYAQTTTWQPRTNAELIAYLYGIVVQLQAQLEALEEAEDDDSQSRSSTVSRGRNPYFVNVITLAPTAISRNAATLKAEVDKGGSDYLDVWFEYGEDVDDDRSKSQTVTQPQRQSITAVIDDLDDDTDYEFRIVAEDEDGNRRYGETRTFTTISRANTQSFSGRPVAETEGAKNISAYGAEIEGFISMNDYKEGYAFMVFGSSRSDVENAEDYASYNDIPISGVIVNKVSVNSQFTGRNTIRTSAYGLRAATKYYYRVCVQYYEDEDDKTDPELHCGEVASFTTLN